MYTNMEEWNEIRRRVLVEKVSHRQSAAGDRAALEDATACDRLGDESAQDAQ